MEDMAYIKATPQRVCADLDCTKSLQPHAKITLYI